MAREKGSILKIAALVAGGAEIVDYLFPCSASLFVLSSISEKMNFVYNFSLESCDTRNWVGWAAHVTSDFVWHFIDEWFVYSYASPSSLTLPYFAAMCKSDLSPSRLDNFSWRFEWRTSHCTHSSRPSWRRMKKSSCLLFILETSSLFSSQKRSREFPADLTYLQHYAHQNKNGNSISDDENTANLTKDLFRWTKNIFTRW